MGVRITNSMTLRTALADVARQRAQLARTQEQASSGLRVNRPSDDPVAARAATVLRAARSETAQYQRNVTQGRGRISATESSLGDAVDALVRARELAIAGANGTMDAVSRADAAQEIATLHARLLADANASSGGTHVFGGHTGDVAPFTVSGAFSVGSPAPTVTFTGDASEVEIEIDEGVRVPTSLDGRRVFLGDGNGDGTPDPGREDLFGVLGDLWNALQANDGAATAATLDRIDRGIDQLDVERTQIGAVDAQLQHWSDSLASRSTDLLARLSDAEDADAAQVFSSLANQEAALTASLQATAKVVQPTLLDFLS